MEYGLLGKKLIYSFSPMIHKYFGDCEYELVECSEEDIRLILSGKKFKGLNITNPYKIMAKEYCDKLDESARKTGCVNTIVNKNGSLYGYNTDYYGFLHMIKKIKSIKKESPFSIIGSGATARMSKVVLEDLECQSIKIISREDIKNHNIEELIKDTEILINCTPIGVYPLVDESFPVEIKKLIKLKHVIDLNYNPLNTRLMIEANELGCKANSGLSMLVAQGKKAAEIFLSKKIDDSLIDEVERKIRKRLLNIVLIGMPGSGKTVIGRELAHRINREFVDIDNCIENLHKMTIQKIIEKNGIRFFRELEKEVVREELLSFSKVFSTGGGVIEDRENWRYLKYNSQVIYIERDLDQLDTKGRPLSQGGIDSLNNIYEKRNPIYKKLSDYRVKNNKSLLETVEEIVKVYEKNFSY